MGSPEAADPYRDPQTGILRNLVGARSQATLDRVEADLVLVRQLQLPEVGIAASRDLLELQAIHLHLFQDIYSWAGEVRTVDLRKTTGRAVPFAPWLSIRQLADNAARDLAADDWLRGLTTPDFIEKLSFHYDTFNYLHPFREGNGRAQRIFWSRVAADAGRKIDWSRVSRSMNDLACRTANEEHDLDLLVEMFNLALVR